jgi:hypothetical protein
MNERIRKLEEQCWEATKYGPPWFDSKKFAELIVEECINVLMKESERLYKLESEEKDELFARDFEVCAEKCVDNVVALKEHFGVE